MALRPKRPYHLGVRVHRMRKLILAAIVGTGLVCLGLLIVKAPTHRLKIRTYLHHTEGLKTGASVSMDGVRIGSVTTVNLGGGSTDHPVEVVTLLDAGQQVSVPNDSVVSLITEGVLGPTVMDIDTRRAIGPPIENNGVIKSLEVTDNQAAHALEVVGNALINASKKLRDKNESSNSPVLGK